MKDKIRKLLALASDPNASDGERDNASRMAKHDIDLADLEEEALKAQFDLIQGMAVALARRTPVRFHPGLKSLPGESSAIPEPVALPGEAWSTSVARGKLAQWLQNTLVSGAYKASQGRANPTAFRNGYAAALQGRLKAMVEQRAEEEVGLDGPSKHALVKVQDVRQKVMDPKGRASTALISKPPRVIRRDRMRRFRRDDLSYD